MNSMDEDSFTIYTSMNSDYFDVDLRDDMDVVKQIECGHGAPNTFVCRDGKRGYALFYPENEEEPAGWFVALEP